MLLLCFLERQEWNLQKKIKQEQKQKYCNYKFNNSKEDNLVLYGLIISGTNARSLNNT